METEIRTLLYTAIGNLGSSEGVTVSYPNVALDATKLDKYFKVSLLPVVPETKGITSGWSIHKWLFQVSVFVRDGVGEIKPLELVDKLRQAFPYNFKFNGAERDYTVIAQAAVAPPIQDGGWYLVPVTFRVMAVN